MNKKTLPKWQKYNCPITKDIDTTHKELNSINNQIIKYFTSTNPEYTNFSFNYIDKENKVIIVGLFLYYIGKSSWHLLLKYLNKVKATATKLEN